VKPDQALDKTMAKARPTSSPTLELEKGLEALDRMIQGVSTREFQEKLAALHATKPWYDFQHMFKLRRELSNSVAIPVIVDYGFDASDEGMNMFMRTLMKPPFRGTAQAQEKHCALRVLLNLDEEAMDDLDIKAPKFGRVWVVTKKCPKEGLPVFETRLTNGKKMGSHLHGDAILQEFGQDNGCLRFRKVSGSGPNYGWVQIEKGIVEPQEDHMKQ